MSDDVCVYLWDSGCPQFDFINLLHNTMLVLGAKPEIVALLDKYNDGNITKEDCIKLADYSAIIWQELKLRQAAFKGVKIKVKDSENE